ncbi:MAG: hypothetical protein E3K37_00275 [Candidatus Kuenenia sp.]|nr:hypothetical protein [Candidatus Kuenenia hertensis]
MYGNRYSARSPELVTGDIRVLSERYSTKYFTFNDEGVVPARIKEVAGAIEDKEIEII